MNKLNKELSTIINNPLLSEKRVSDMVLNVLYKFNKDTLLIMFAQIQELDRQAIKKENMVLYRGLEDGIHNFANLATELTEGKNKAKADKYLGTMFFDDDICSVINICKAYFPTGNSKGASNSGKWYFNLLIDILKNYGKDYKKGGKSYDWTVNIGHSDYLKLVFSEMEKNYLLEKKDLAVGCKVHYVPKHYIEKGKWENGIIKEIPDATEAFVRVVYNCADDWGNYMNYTSALTNLQDLRLGWKTE